MAEDVIRYADAQKLDRFTILGHSMGGKTSMALAMLHPHRIDGIIVADAPPKNGMKDPRYASQTLHLVFLK